MIRDNKHNFLDIYLTPENATNKDYVHKFRLEVSTRYCHTITIRYCHTITTRYCHTVTTRYCHTTLLTVPQCTLPSDAMARYRSGHFSSIPPTVPPYHSIVSLYYIPLCTVIPLNICVQLNRSVNGKQVGATSPVKFKAGDDLQVDYRITHCKFNTNLFATDSFLLNDKLAHFLNEQTRKLEMKEL